MTPCITSITISNEAAKRALAGELWFSERDVVGRKPKIAGIARLIDKKKRHIAMAFVSPGSRYFLRVFSGTKADASREFWRERILRAYEKRAPLEKITNAYRVVFAESDGIPSVVIDRYNDVYAIQITSAGAETIKKELIGILIQEFLPASVIEKNDSALRMEGGLSSEDIVAYGSKTVANIFEGEKRFELDVLRGQKTGAYLDYRNFRLKAREFAKGDSLDAFSYQGWFSCQIAGAAKKVTAVDSSAFALAAARKNADMNGIQNIEFVKADAFDFISECGQKFDLVHLDPPSFAKGRGNLKSALEGYKRLLAKALPLVRKNGALFISSCSHAITAGALEKTLLACINAAGMKGKVIYRGIQDTDHPVLAKHPESLYLKAVAVKVSLRGTK